jgi:hypothetical protein
LLKNRVAAFDELELKKNVWHSLIMPSAAETTTRNSVNSVGTISINMKVDANSLIKKTKKETKGVLVSTESRR